MIERSHLSIIRTLHDKGTLTEAAKALHLSQSALSHQIRYLEKKLDVALWERQGRNLRLTQAGNLLLRTAQRVLPVLEQAEQTLKAYGEGRQGVLRIGVECYPCHQWLTGAIGDFLRQMPDVDIDIVNKFQFSGLEGLLNQHIDILITPDRVQDKNIGYDALASYELMLVVSAGHPLAGREAITPEDLLDATLLTFPVPSERLDILVQFLNPAGIRPARIKKIESVELMLTMVGLGRGVCVLPEWLADNYRQGMTLQKIRLGEQGMWKKLFIALRGQDREIAYMQQFIAIGRETAGNRFGRH